MAAAAGAGYAAGAATAATCVGCVLRALPPAQLGKHLKHAPRWNVYHCASCHGDFNEDDFEAPDLDEALDGAIIEWTDGFGLSNQDINEDGETEGCVRMPYNLPCPGCEKNEIEVTIDATFSFSTNMDTYSLEAITETHSAEVKSALVAPVRRQFLTTSQQEYEAYIMKIEKEQQEREEEEWLMQEQAEKMNEAAAAAVKAALAQAPQNIFFTPAAEGKESAREAVQTFIGQAEESLKLMIYSLTHEDLVDAIVVVAKRLPKGSVRLIIDRDQYAKYQENRKKKLQGAYAHQARDDIVERLTGAGCKVRQSSGHGGGKYNAMHRKSLLIDGKHVALGSFNYTYPATMTNYEEVVIMMNSQIADELNEAFEALWKKSA